MTLRLAEFTGTARDRARPGRLSVIDGTGALRTSFAADATRTDIAALLAKAGYTLHPDDSISPPADS